MIRKATVALLAALSLTVLTVTPVAAGDDVIVTVEVVAKLDSAAVDAVTVALEEEGFLLDSVIASRNVYLFGKIVEVDADKIIEKSDDEAKDFAKDLEDLDDVTWAEPVWIEDAEDTRFHAWPSGSKSGKDEIDNDDVFDDLDLETAHLTATGDGVVVAVLDTGIDADHEFFEGRVLQGYDLVDDDADPSEAMDGVDNDGDGLADEAYGHGTFVAGVVLQVAPGATILPIRVLDADGQADLPTVVEGITMALEMGADVINLSLSLPSNEKPDLLKDILEDAKKADVLVVGASGNTGSDDKLYPASEGSVLSVGAIDVDDPDEVVGFSSYGNWVRVAAPGVDIVSSIPGGYATWAGTSVATPVVSGQAALLLEIEPDAKHSDLFKAIKDSADKMSGKYKTEKGIINILESFDKIG